jgi:hypothetical protein
MRRVVLRLDGAPREGDPGVDDSALTYVGTVTRPVQSAGGMTFDSGRGNVGGQPENGPGISSSTGS